MAESAQVAVRPEGQDTCVHHKGRALKLFCEKCQDVACTKCVTTVHKGHLMSDLSDITSSITEDIRGFVEDTEGNKLPQCQKNIQSTIDELVSNSEYFDNLSKEARDQADILEDEIEDMTVETLSLYQHLKENNASLMLTYTYELEEGQTKLRKQLHECKQLLQTASEITLFDAKDKVKRLGVQPLDKPVLQTASFNPTKTYREFLEKAFGSRTTSSETQSETQTVPLPSKFMLLPEVRVLGSRETKLIANALCCNLSQETHICYPRGNYSDLQVFDAELKEQNKMRIETDTADISIARKINHICMW